MLKRHSSSSRQQHFTTRRGNGHQLDGPRSAGRIQPYPSRPPRMQTRRPSYGRVLARKAVTPAAVRTLSMACGLRIVTGDLQAAERRPSRPHAAPGPDCAQYVEVPSVTIAITVTVRAHFLELQACSIQQSEPRTIHTPTTLPGWVAQSSGQGRGKAVARAGPWTCSSVRPAREALRKTAAAPDSDWSIGHARGCRRRAGS